MSENSNTQLTYDAFISYRHTEPDMFVARNLHREMEAFRLPHNIARKIGEKGKTRITRVFRDKDELPLASNLEEPIRYALEASDFLVVICSPRLTESAWCRKEIETFLELKGREKILAVLIEGEPDESFPDILRFADGVPIEPLAADVRGKNQREIKKKIKEEMLRLAAPMFGCAYDELKQRHRERKIKRILTACAVGSAVCLLFGTVSTTMALKIQNQNKEIKAQSEQIAEQKDEILLQYTEAMKSNAGLKAEDALLLLEQGDRVGAVAEVREVLPNTREDAKLPYVDRAEYALCEGLQVYANGDSLLAKENLKHDANVYYLKISPDKRTLLTVDDSAIITLWDVESGKQLLKIEDFMEEVLKEETTITFVDDGHIACLAGMDEENNKPRVVIYDIESGETQTVTVESGYYLASDGKGQLAVLGFKELYLIRDGQIYGMWTSEEGYSFAYDAWSYNEDGSRFAFAQGAEGDSYIGQVVVIDTATGETTNCYATEYDLFKELRFAGNVLYVVHNQNLFTLVDDLGDSIRNNVLTDGMLYACNLNTYDALFWKYHSEKVTLEGLVPAGAADSNLLLLNGVTQAIAINAVTGEFLSMYDYGEKLVETGALANKEWFVGYTRSGSINLLRMVNGDLVSTQSQYAAQLGNNILKEIVSGNGYIITLAYADTNVTIWSYLQGLRTVDYTTVDDSFYQSELSAQQNRILLQHFQDNNYDLLDAETGEKKYELCTSVNFVSDCGFTGEQGEHVAVLSGPRVDIYSSQDGTAEKGYDLEYYPNTIELAGLNNQFLLATDAKQLKIHDTLNGELLYTADLDKALDMNDCLSLNEDGTCAAVSLATEKTLKILSVQENKELDQIPIKAAFISKIFFHKGEKEQLFVVYKDNNVELYDIDSGEIKLNHSFHTFTDNITGISEGEEGSYILFGDAESYYMDGIEIRGRIPELKMVDWNRREFMTGGSTTLYKTPIYSYEELISEADAYLAQH